MSFLSVNKGQTLQEGNESLWGMFMSLERQATCELGDFVISVYYRLFTKADRWQTRKGGSPFSEHKPEIITKGIFY